jgi:hypothetical protein
MSFHPTVKTKKDTFSSPAINAIYVIDLDLLPKFIEIYSRRSAVFSLRNWPPICYNANDNLNRFSLLQLPTTNHQLMLSNHSITNQFKPLISSRYPAQHPTIDRIKVTTA